MQPTTRKTILKDVRFLGVPGAADDSTMLRGATLGTSVEPGAATGPGREAVAEAIGRNVARLRTTAGLVLEALAERAGVPAERLAQIEAGDAFPGLRTIWRLATALSVPFGALLDGAIRSEASDAELRVQRAGVGDVVGTPTGLRSRVLTAEGIAGAPEVYEITLRGGAAEAAEPHGRAVCEQLVVTSGTLVVQVGEEEVRLGSGDSLFFRADRPHRYLNPDAAEARALLVMVYA